MGNTTVPTAVQEQVWADKLFEEYVRDAGFGPYTGKTENAPIQLVTDLTKKSGDQITVKGVGRLSEDPVLNDDTLTDNEEELDTFGHKITVQQIRKAVSRGEMEQQKTSIDLLEEGRTMAKNWSQEYFDSEIITAAMSPCTDGSTAYASATEAQKDAWVDANYDRVLFGAAISNTSTSAPSSGCTYDHSASLQNVDASGDVLTPAIVQLMKRRIEDADPNIRPIKVDNQGEYFVLFVPSYAFRDFKASTAMQNMMMYGAARGDNNPLFTDGDLMVDNVVVHKVPGSRMDVGTVGAASCHVGACFMMGAQAVAVAWARMTHVIRRTETDYDNVQGVGIAEIRGTDKIMRLSGTKYVQHGMGTLYVANVADT